MPVLRFCIYFISLLLFSGLHAQRVFVNTLGKLFEINTTTTPYTFSEITGFCTQFAETEPFSIAVYKNTMYYNTNSSSRVYGFNLNNPGQCRVIGDFNSIPFIISQKFKTICVNNSASESTDRLKWLEYLPSKGLADLC